MVGGKNLKAGKRQNLIFILEQIDSISVAQWSLLKLYAHVSFSEYSHIHINFLIEKHTKNYLTTQYWLIPFLS